MKLVLLALCNFANKRTGRIFATAQTVANFCNLSDLRTVRTAQKKLCADGYLVDTGERTGGNGRVPVFLPGWNKETEDKLSASHAPSSAKTKDKLSASHAPSSGKLRTNWVQSKDKLGASDAPSFIGKVGPNLKPVTSSAVVVGKALGNSIPSGGDDNAPKTTTTTNWDVLLAELKRQYPQHNIGYEFAQCRQYNAKQGKKVTPTLLRKWMKRAEVPIVRPSRPKQNLPPPPEPPPPTPEEIVKAAKFLKEFEERQKQKRKTAETQGTR